MGVIDYLRAIYPLNTVHNTNDQSVLVHGTLTSAISGGTVTSVVSGGTMTVVPTVPQSQVASLTSVTGNASNVVLDSTRAGRIGMLAVNDSTSTLFLKYGLVSSSISYSVQMPPAAYWEMPQPIYTGEIDGIWAAANTGAARITILT